MRQFAFVVTDPLGVHARPAGLLARAAKEFEGTQITITKGETTAKASQLMKLMSLGIRQGDTITVTAEGDREDQAIEAMRSFLKENL